ncbi:hypothetical protein MKW94_018582 [Papaver nudicaule]|uniref:Uncharacterized protein n=1 Tax=Papaver nudicaule TaxID=74823 RepID=A0AA41SK82_PAPNU|nr:hypothetical protein [Papaver nudicaule]
MTTIRRLCCNDLLDITYTTIHLDMPSLSFHMGSMALFPEYCLVVEGPGNRIRGFICAYNWGEGEEKHCEIADLIHIDENIAEMLVQALEVKADKIQKVYYVKMEVHDQQSIDLFKSVSSRRPSSC